MRQYKLQLCGEEHTVIVTPRMLLAAICRAFEGWVPYGLYTQLTPEEWRVVRLMDQPEACWLVAQYGGRIYV